MRNEDFYNLNEGQESSHPKLSSSTWSFAWDDCSVSSISRSIRMMRYLWVSWIMTSSMDWEIGVSRSLSSAIKVSMGWLLLLLFQASVMSFVCFISFGMVSFIRFWMSWSSWSRVCVFVSGTRAVEGMSFIFTMFASKVSRVCS